jgi:hypothetical protein
MRSLTASFGQAATNRNPARQDNRLFLLTNRRASATVFQKAAIGRLARLMRAGRPALAAARSEKGVKSLKTNNSAKCPDFAP